MSDLIDRQPVAKDINVPVSDCISIQAAIDVLIDKDSKSYQTNGWRYYE